MKVYPIKNKSGAAIPFVILTSLIIISMCTYFFILTAFQVKINRIAEEKMKAKYIAEAGIEHFISDSSIKNSQIPLEDKSSNEIGNYEIVDSSIPGNYITKGTTKKGTIAEIEFSYDSITGNITIWKH